MRGPREVPNTYMVSVIEGEGGSKWWSERAGKDPLEAAQGYINDDDCEGAARVRHLLRIDQIERLLICVLDKDVNSAGERWRIHLFEIVDEPGKHWFDHSLREFC